MAAYVAGPRLLDEFEADIADLGDVTDDQRDRLFDAWLRFGAVKAAIRVGRELSHG